MSRSAAVTCSPRAAASSADANPSALEYRIDGSSSMARARTARIAAACSPTVSPVRDADLLARACRTAAGQQFERNRGQREHVGRRAPRLAGDPLRGGIRTADRRAQPDAFERVDDAEAARARLVRSHEDVAQVQRAVPDARGAREVDRASQLREEWQRLVERGRRVVADRDVERLAGDVLLRAVRDRAFDAGGDRLDDRRMEEARIRGARQLVGERLRLFWRDVEPEDLDRDEPIAGGLVRSEDRSKRANTDLMQHPKRAKRGRWSECSRVVSGQFRAGAEKCNTVLAIAREALAGSKPRSTRGTRQNLARSCRTRNPPPREMRRSLLWSS